MCCVALCSVRTGESGVAGCLGGIRIEGESNLVGESLRLDGVKLERSAIGEKEGVGGAGVCRRVCLINRTCLDLFRDVLGGKGKVALFFPRKARRIGAIEQPQDE